MRPKGISPGGPPSAQCDEYHEDVTAATPHPCVDALRALDFGKVDSESEPDLDRRFVRTQDFDRFARRDIWLALSAKGTGKSALFELFAKYEDVARALVPGGLSDVRITTGTGFSDLSETATGDIESLRGERSFDHDRLWRLYIAVRAGISLGDSRHIPKGPLHDLLVAVGREKDYRVLPLLKDLWQLVVGESPKEIRISSYGATVALRGGKRTLDVVALLDDIQTALDAEGKSLWILFDKIDEIFPHNRTKRLQALEGLMTCSTNVPSNSA